MQAVLPGRLTAPGQARSSGLKPMMVSVSFPRSHSFVQLSYSCRARTTHRCQGCSTHRKAERRKSHDRWCTLGYRALHLYQENSSGTVRSAPLLRHAESQRERTELLCSWIGKVSIVSTRYVIERDVCRHHARQGRENDNGNYPCHKKPEIVRATCPAGMVGGSDC